jgi:hypothetical protein
VRAGVVSRECLPKIAAALEQQLPQVLRRDVEIPPDVVQIIGPAHDVWGNRTGGGEHELAQTARALTRQGGMIEARLRRDEGEEEVWIYLLSSRSRYDF